MPIALRIKHIALELEEARKLYRRGQIELPALQTLAQQARNLLDQARGTEHEQNLLCIHALARAMETLATQKAKLTRETGENGLVVHVADASQDVRKAISAKPATPAMSDRVVTSQTHPSANALAVA